VVVILKYFAYFSLSHFSDNKKVNKLYTRKEILVLVFIIFTCTHVKSQIKLNPDITVSAGTSTILSTESYSKYYRNGYNVNLCFGFQVKNNLFLQGHFGFNEFDLDEINILKASKLNQTGIYVVGQGSNLYSFSTTIKKIFLYEAPYILGGFGLYKFSFDELGVRYGEWGKEETVLIQEGEKGVFFGTSIGTGMDFNISDKLGIIFEFRYYTVIKKQTITYLCFSTGLTFK